MGKISIPRFKEDCVVSKGIEVQELLKIRKETVLYVQPCVSERGKLIADVELGKGSNVHFIDPEVMCSLLQIHRRRFAELKCSPSLGVAKVKWKGREISIFKNGKLKIQRVLNENEVLRIATSMSRLIWGATICEVCGLPALSCASGECEKCVVGGEEEVIDVDEFPNRDLLCQVSLDLEKAKKSRGRSGLHRARYLSLFFTMEASHKKEAILGLALLGKVQRIADRER